MEGIFGIVRVSGGSDRAGGRGASVPRDGCQSILPRGATQTLGKESEVCWAMVS